jgi:iron complex outermembrane recepter protein
MEALWRMDLRHLSGAPALACGDGRTWADGGFRFMRSRTLGTASALVLAMAAGAVSAPANAADAIANGVPQATLDEVIVTAQKTSENLQTVPLAITALSGDFLDRSKVEGFVDLKSRVPSLAYDEFAPGQPRYYIRGIGNINKSSGVDPGVAIFVDDVYMGRPSMTSTDFTDLDRVEVLRGPQGTLFGRNATGGAVSFFTRKPDRVGRFDGQVTTGNYGLYGASAVVGGPLADGISVKLGATARTHKGYAFNEIAGKDVEDEDFAGVRGAIRFQPNDAWDIQLNVDGSRRRGTGPWWDLAVESAADVGKSNPIDVGYADIDNAGASLTVNWKTDIGTVTSISAYRNAQNHNRANTTGLNVLPLSDPDRRNQFTTLFIQQDDENATQYSQELRVDSELGPRFKFVVGAFFFHDDVFHQKLTDYDFVLFGPTGLAGRFSFNANNKTDGYAVFANGAYQLTDDLKIEAGLRWSHDKKEHNVIARGRNYAGFMNNGAPVAGYDAPASASWSALTPMASINYQATPDAMVYATVSRGFKSGGFNDTDNDRASALRPFNPEYVWNYEMGTKTEWFDRRLRLNATAFYMNYQDLQVTIVTIVDPALPPIYVNGNAGKTTIKGLEFEFDAVPMEGLNFYGNYTYTDANINRLTTGGVSYAGKKLPHVPKNKFFAGASITRPVGGFSVTGRVDYAYQSNYFGTIANLSNERSLSQTNVDAGLTITAPGRHWAFEIWGKNLTNELNINTITASSGDGFATYLPPKTYGVTLHVNY